MAEFLQLGRQQPITQHGDRGGGIAYGDEWLGKESAEEEEGEIATFPTRNQTAPTIESQWDSNMAKGRWDQSLCQDSSEWALRH